MTMGKRLEIPPYKNSRSLFKEKCISGTQAIITQGWPFYLRFLNIEADLRGKYPKIKACLSFLDWRLGLVGAAYSQYRNSQAKEGLIRGDLNDSTNFMDIGRLLKNGIYVPISETLIMFYQVWLSPLPLTKSNLACVYSENAIIAIKCIALHKTSFHIGNSQTFESELEETNPLASFQAFCPQSSISVPKCS